MNEASLLARLPASRRGLLLGIGDDAAVFRPRASQDLVFTADLFIEGIHFRARGRDRIPPAHAGHRALARSLSDIAAMGARPRFCLVSLALAPWTTARWFDAFYRGFLRLAERHGCTLAGGDLSHASKLCCNVMVCGSVPKGRALRRDSARPGDAIYVSGPLGGWRHRPLPEPRLDIARKILGRATSAIDLSDGLALDLHRLCLASQVSARLDLEPPLLRGATLDEALHAGEDYELLYTAPPRLRLPGHRLGVIEAGPPGRIALAGQPIEPHGYDHFQSRPHPRSH